MYNGPNDKLFHNDNFGHWWAEIIMAEDGRLDLFDRQIRPYDDEPVRCTGASIVSSSHEIAGYYELNNKIAEAMSK